MHVHGCFWKEQLRAATRQALAWYYATMDLQVMSVRMPPDLHEQLRLAAFEHRVSMNALVCEGIELRLAELKAAATEDQ
jgi:predicted HicB family RNase H-like nuclease